MPVKGWFDCEILIEKRISGLVKFKLLKEDKPNNYESNIRTNI